MNATVFPFYLLRLSIKLCTCSTLKRTARLLRLRACESLVRGSSRDFNVPWLLYAYTVESPIRRSLETSFAVSNCCRFICFFFLHAVVYLFELSLFPVIKGDSSMTALCELSFSPVFICVERLFVSSRLLSKTHIYWELLKMSWKCLLR